MYKGNTYDLLLIEDDPGDARLIEEYLNESTVRFKSNLTIEPTLQAGCNKLNNEEFDLILLDLSLPDSFGLKTLEKVNEVSGRPPIIVLTGLKDEEIGVEAVKSGAQDFLTIKELNETLLNRSISYAIQRYRLSRQLDESQERLKQAQELAHMGNYELDLKTGEVTWSDETFRIFEMDPEESAPNYEELKPMILPQYQGDIDTVIRKVQEQEQRDYLELGIKTKQGKTKYLYSIVDPIKNKSGEVVKIFGTTQEITDLKKAEHQLRENEQRYRMLFQGTTDEILVFQVDDKMNPLPFMEINDVACKLLGYTREELLQKTLYDLIPNEKTEIQKRISNVLSNGQTIHESNHITKDGKTIPLEISARSFTYNGRPTIISIGRDVRERRKLEQEILDISEQERQRIGRNLHDSLGQMLTGIGLVSQNLAKKLKANSLPGSEEVQEIADMIKEADLQARSLSHGLVPVNLESNGLDAALRELTVRSEKMFSLAVDYVNSSAATLEDNSKAIHLYRIAQEAINNAVKHGEASLIQVELSSLDNQITLSIEDDGKGLPDESDVISDGMGIRIMHFRSHMIGGSLKINSAKGEGTEIICQIPIENKILQ